MKILGLPHIAGLNARTELRVWASAWVAEVRYATWRQPGDVITQFPSAVQIAIDRFRFYAHERLASVEVSIAYPQGIVLILFADVESHGL